MSFSPGLVQKLAVEAREAIRLLKITEPHLLTEGKIIDHMVMGSGGKAPQQVLKAVDARFLKNKNYETLIQDMAAGNTMNQLLDLHLIQERWVAHLRFACVVFAVTAVVLAYKLFA